MQSAISVTMISSKNIEITHLAENWLSLENRSQCSFFLTWAWIGQWLTSLSTEYFVLQASDNNKVLGLAIMVKNTRKVFGLFPIKQWWLNRTGNEAYDQCWIEYNDFLVASEQAEKVNQAMLNFLSSASATSQWHELIVGMADNTVINKFTQLAHQPNNQLKNKIRTLFNDVGYGVNYCDIKTSYERDVLSRNTRQKLRQSKSLLEVNGAISLAVYTNNADKQACLPALAKLHIERWQNTVTPSGFINPVFQQMITQIILQPSTEIVALKQHNEALAYLVNFIYQGKVYFYLSALSVIKNNKIKLGMLLQQMAIEHYQKQGLLYYDLLAGDAVYKKSLTNTSYEQSMICVFIPNIVLKIEQKLRTIKLKLMNKKNH